MAQFSGAVMLVLGIALLLEVARRIFSGSQPAALPIMGAALVSLSVNIYVLKSPRSFRSGEVHLRAAWMFTRADVIASLGVFLAAGLVSLSHLRIPDLVVTWRPSHEESSGAAFRVAA